MNKLLFLDCDSTLCAIEGVDELAALRGPDIEKKVIDLTNQAMDGSIPIDEIFARRLDLIQPSAAMCEQVGAMYIEKLSPHAEETIERLRQEGWEAIIISGGFTQVIAPVAKRLGIEQVFAVDLCFSNEGEYTGFDEQSPTARNGGKPEIIETIKAQSSPTHTVMVGDGISDLESQKAVNLFIGYGGVIARDSVKKGSKSFVYSFADIPKIIQTYLFD